MNLQERLQSERGRVSARDYGDAGPDNGNQTMGISVK
jgi:hypothetical protein